MRAELEQAGILVIVDYRVIQAFVGGRDIPVTVVAEFQGIVVTLVPERAVIVATLDRMELLEAMELQGIPVIAVKADIQATREVD